MDFFQNKLITKRGEMEFKYKIQDVKHYDDLHIVMLNIPNTADEVDNVYGVNEDGNIVWRIENPVEAFNISSDAKGYDYYKKSIYVGFLEPGGNILYVVTFSGMKYQLNCVNGKLLKVAQSRW